MHIVSFIKNVVKPSYVNEAVRKILMRLTMQSIDKKGSEQSVMWCESNLTDWEVFAQNKDLVLFEEAETFQKNLFLEKEKKESELGMKIGGAGHFPLMYFLTRYYKPNTIVETGVAFGFSSRASLMAIQKNWCGHLYSSDLPYFRVKTRKSSLV